jgi:dCTP deaminase
MIKNDMWIKQMVKKYNMISPFSDFLITKRKVSYGVSSYGYDASLSREFMIIKNNVKEIDPKKITNDLFKSFIVNDNYIVVKPNSMILGKTVEYFKIPRNILAISFGKSTYARSGIFINTAPFEPEWEGYVTLSIVNTSRIPVKIYINEGIIQVLFLESDDVCEISYSDRKGKYNKQNKICCSKIL